MNRAQTLRTIVLIFGLLAAGLAAICLYQYAGYAAAARATVDQQDALQQAVTYQQELNKLRADGRKMSEKVKQRKGPWTWSEQLPVMVEQISVIMEQNAAKIDTLQPSPAVERDQLTRFPLRLNLRTDLQHLTAVMQRLREAVPLLAVDHLAIRAGEKPGDLLQVEMTLTSYVIVDGQATGGRP
ncbi:MAG: type 4a pilus biogenesis protein PilO [Armatimonadota bacterium]